MSVNTIVYQNDNYRFYTDNRYGVCWWERIADGATSMLNTGVDAEQEIKDIKQLAAMTAINRDACFDVIASDLEFTL